MDQATEPVHGPQQVPRRLIAYVDILGWSELTNRGEAERIREAFALIERIHAEEKEQRGHLVASYGPVASTSGETTFSDSIVYSCFQDDWEIAWMVGRVQWICSRLLIAGHPTRGALCFGELEHTEHRIAGKALVEAHRIEREIAVYPRLVLTRQAEQMVTSSGVRWSHQPQIQHDRDGLPFLEIVGISAGRTRTRHARRIAELAVDSCQRELGGIDPGDRVRAMNHRAKYGWLMSYLNGVLADPPAPNDNTVLPDADGG